MQKDFQPPEDDFDKHVPAPPNWKADMVINLVKKMRIVGLTVKEERGVEEP